MLARLQQGLTLGALALASLWAAVCVHFGHLAWAAIGAVLIVGMYAIVLALEFALLNRVHGADPTPRASAAQLLHAWWGEVRAAPTVFCWRQPFFSRRWPDHLPANSTGRRGVLLVHGFVCNRGVWNPWLRRLHALDIPVVAIDLEPVFGSIDDYVLLIEHAVQRLERATGLAPVVVAHSMGGLAVRRWWASQMGQVRLHHVITLGSPHRGTWLARLAVTANSRQMAMNSEWLRSLALRETPSHTARFTCYYSHCDNIVFPPANGMLVGADNRHLPGVAHVHMVDHAQPWAELLRLLGQR